MGDNIFCHIAPDTIIGNIVAPTIPGFTDVYVSSTVTANAQLGYYVDLLEITQTGPVVNDLGRVIAIDAINSKITVETPPSIVFSPYSPTYVRMTIRHITNYEIGKPGSYNIGSGKIGGSYIMANTPILIGYINNGGTPKSWWHRLNICNKLNDLAVCKNIKNLSCDVLRE